MTEPEKTVVEQPAYVPDPEKEKQAKAVHATISILRLLGAIIAVLGIVIVAGRFPQIPPYPGYAMIVSLMIKRGKLLTHSWAHNAHTPLFPITITRWYDGVELARRTLLPPSVAA